MVGNAFIQLSKRVAGELLLPAVYPQTHVERKKKRHGIYLSAEMPCQYLKKKDAWHLQKIYARENPSDESIIDRVWHSSITGTLSCLL
jgi:hypothetical protein